MLIVVDQFPEWSFEQRRPELVHGFARLLADGEWHVGRHPSAATLTASGHALLGSGQPPARSGIVANEWWSRELSQVVTATEDAAGLPTSQWLRVSGLGDVVDKAVGVSLKARAALLPLGHRGLAIYYDGKTGTWRTFGRHAAPPWLATHMRAHPIVPRIQTWQADPRIAKLAEVADDQPGEVGIKGLGATFPHDPHKTKSATEAVFALPLGNEIVFETALAAIAGEQLGRDRKPDLLILSLSTHDYIAHGWGHESWEAWDSELRLDKSLDEFLAGLDREVGAGKWALVLTSDHGGTPLPEKTAGGRYSFEQLAKAANDAASAVLGPGEWIAYVHYPTVYLSKAARAQDPKEVRNALKKIVLALRAFPGLDRVDLVESVAGNCERRTGEERALCLTFDRERSGEVYFMPARGWVLQEADEPLATAHGSLHDYDRLVPVIVLPFGRKRHAAPAAPSDEIDLASVAPMLATWLGVQLPR